MTPLGRRTGYPQWEDKLFPFKGKQMNFLPEKLMSGHFHVAAKVSEVSLQMQMSISLAGATGQCLVEDLTFWVRY